MNTGEGFVLTIFFWIIGLIVLFLVIRTAINGSDLANDVSAIKEMLEADRNEDADEEAECTAKNNITYNYCPACGSKLSEADTECPECGLSLK